MAATGGTITTSGNYTIHTFTSSGTFTPSQALTVEYLIVAGGGGAGKGAPGMQQSGPGGAGGLIYKTGVSVTAQEYAVVVGDKGLGGNNRTATNGGNSSFNSDVAIGGGPGGAARSPGVSGGSGGAAGSDESVESRDGGSATTGQGNRGGKSFYNYPGGGGGATSAGGDAKSSSAGTAGAGLSNSITGTAVTYARGGYAGTASTTHAAANTGNGGDVGASSQYSACYDGGSGVVIIRYLTPTTIIPPAPICIF